MNKSRYVFFILACLFGLYVQAQNRTVKGRVLSAEDKEPLIGATVKIPGTSIGVVTDIDGNFSLEVPNKDKTLVIEFLGMSTLTAKIPANGVLNVSLRPDTQRLDEVVVTGYGNFSKSSFTGSANTLRGDLLKNVPVVSVEQKLQGMTPGVSISGNSGQPVAQKQVKLEAVLDEIIRVENITVSDEEMDEQYELISQKYGQPVDVVKQVLPKAQLKPDLLRMKASQLIIDAAEIIMEESGK